MKKQTLLICIAIVVLIIINVCCILGAANDAEDILEYTSDYTSDIYGG